jgi:hypothetical protein
MNGIYKRRDQVLLRCDRKGNFLILEFPPVDQMEYVNKFGNI